MKIISNEEEIKKQARRLVNDYIKLKLLQSPKDQRCYKCKGFPAQHYHHYLGYAKTNWLDIVPLCVQCHKSEHTIKHKGEC